MIEMVSMADGRPDQPIRDADDDEVRLQLRPRQVRQTRIQESFVEQNLNSDFFDVSIRYNNFFKNKNGFMILLKMGKLLVGLNGGRQRRKNNAH